VTLSANDRRAGALAVAASVATVAFQLAGKATRDALFLSTFGVDALPRMFIAAAIVSATLTILLTRVMVRVGPARLVPPLFAISSVLLLGEWWLTTIARPVAAVAVYLHFAGLGALLVSGFWAIVNERFDPRTARGTIGRITTGASLGGVLGGVLSERVGALFQLPMMLPVLATLHLVAALCLWKLLSPRPTVTASSAPGRTISPRQVFARSGYLRQLALLVVLTAIVEGLLDYAFKVSASEMFSDGDALLRFFAAFHLIAAMLTIALQLVVLRVLLERAGIGRAVALLPGGVAGGATIALLMPGALIMFGLRALEMVLRGSVFRAGYEMLFTPVAPEEKRATKLLVDVGAARIGDVIGALIVQSTILLGLVTTIPLLFATLVVAILALIVAQRLETGYTRALGRSLKRQAHQLGPEPVASAMLETFGALDLNTLRQEIAISAPGAPGPSVESNPLPPSPSNSLSSAQPEAVRRALLAPQLTPEQIEQVIGLLPWDAIAPDAIQALRRLPPEDSPKLLQHLLDPQEDFAVRRRLIPVLADRPSQENFDGLLRALGDARFEVRYRAGQALSRMASRMPRVRVDRDRVLATIMQEVDVERGVWESRQIIDQGDVWSSLEADVLRDRATRSLEHVFTLLSLILPRETVMIAFHGLHTSDPYLRGTALEYLEAVLPEQLRQKLWPFLEAEDRIVPARRNADQAVQQLLASRESIMLALDRVRGKSDP
jgi:ATP/ADP translocase